MQLVAYITPNDIIADGNGTNAAAFQRQNRVTIDGGGVSPI